MINFQIAEALAADLAGSSVDPNEAQKALAYLRSKHDGKALFDYLQAIVNNGQAVVRSRQTMDYYRNLQVACQRHLRPLQGDYSQMVAAFAWSLRLLRYYRAVPDASREKAEQPRQINPSPEPPPPTAPARPAAPTIPAVGDVFAGKVSAVDATAVLIAIPGFGDDKAIGVLKAADLGGKKFSVGNMARVEVTGLRALKSGRTIVELRPGAKKPE